MPLARARWAVIDCETSGLDARRDRLLSVAAVAVADGRIALRDSLAAVVRPSEPSAADNILVHGLGADVQLGGRDRGEVVAELDAFIGDAIPVAFHAPFDRAILARAGLRAARRRWLDLAVLAPALFPKNSGSDLDAWLAAFGIDCPERHDALADAYATAQLMLVVLAEAHRQRIASAEALAGLAASAAWLGT